MAKSEDSLGYQRVRRYRVRSGLSQAVVNAGFDRREAEPGRNWACVTLEPGLRDRREAETYRDPPPRSEPPRRGNPSAEVARRRPPERVANREPVADDYDDYFEARHDYDYCSDYYRAPFPEREGLAVRVVRVLVAIVDRFWRLRTVALGTPFLLAACVFAAGVVLENQVRFLSWVAELLVAAAATVRDWVKPGPQTALLFAGLITATGIWLLKRVVSGPAVAPRASRRVCIHRDALERHR
jgi:hypothetical protein